MTDLLTWAESIPLGLRTTYPSERAPLLHILGPDLVWLNGNGRTRNRADIIGRGVRALAAADRIIVPLDALRGAGVDYRTIEPIEIHGETWEYELVASAFPPPGMTRDPAGQVVVRGKSIPCVAWGIVREIHADTVGYVVGHNFEAQAVRLIKGRYYWHDSRHWLGDSVFTAERDGQRACFISSFDRQETNPLYFLSQLPGSAETVDQALELLAPESVKTAREMGREVVRQGDMFAIPMDVSTRELTAMGATYRKRVVKVGMREPRRFIDAMPLMGTAHTATEVCTLPDGRQYVRGMLYHDPAVIGETRRADHRRRKLGKAWHLIARNTVPVNSPKNDTRQRVTGKGE